MLKINNLKIYNKSLELVVVVYDLINKNKNFKMDFSLCDQLKRAAVSVSANISEGYFRSKKQTQNYLEIASGSTNEMVTLLAIVNLVYKINTDKLQEEYIILGKQINSFSSSLN